MFIFIYLLMLCVACTDKSQFVRARSNAACHVEHAKWIGDGWCDSESDDTGYNTAECNWDGGVRVSSETNYLTSKAPSWFPKFLLLQRTLCHTKDCCKSTCIDTWPHNCGVSCIIDWQQFGYRFKTLWNCICYNQVIGYSCHDPSALENSPGKAKLPNPKAGTSNGSNTVVGGEQGSGGSGSGSDGGGQRTGGGGQGSGSSGGGQGSGGDGQGSGSASNIDSQVAGYSKIALNYTFYSIDATAGLFLGSKEVVTAAENVVRLAISAYILRDNTSSIISIKIVPVSDARALSTDLSRSLREKLSSRMIASTVLLQASESSILLSQKRLNSSVSSGVLQRSIRLLSKQTTNGTLDSVVVCLSRSLETCYQRQRSNAVKNLDSCSMESSPWESIYTKQCK